ncbi:putative repeat protein (TIGR02543 family) [Lachnospiraceae bacterium PM6-15]|uniref:InlB B-repeat-containing protein n=1 Tax=Ohessyouella blattaphilus TaxID=2949333 RepID=UPI003E254337
MRFGKKLVVLISMFAFTVGFSCLGVSDASASTSKISIYMYDVYDSAENKSLVVEGYMYEEVEGISYDLKTSTLTLDNYCGASLRVTNAPNDFKLQINGECILATFEVQGECAVIGEGTLDITGNSNPGTIANGFTSTAKSSYQRTNLVIDGPLIKVNGSSFTVGTPSWSGMGTFGQLHVLSGGLEVSTMDGFTGMTISVDSVKGSSLPPVVFPEDANIVLKEGDTSNSIAEVSTLTNTKVFSLYNGETFSSKSFTRIYVEPIESMVEEYTLTFDANGGVVDIPHKQVVYGQPYGMLPVLQKAGYSFGGWYASNDESTAMYESTLVSSEKIVDIAANQTVYARWVANSYSIFFNGNGGSLDTEGKVVTYGSTYGELPTPTRPGYTFKGWFTSKTGEKQVLSTMLVEITQNQNLYAQWAPEYEVTFNANGGSVLTVTKMVTKGLNYGALPTPIKNGYIFKGWYTSKTGDNEVTEATAVTITKKQNLYAQWLAKCVTVNFNANGGTVETSNKKVTYASTYGSLPTPIKNGYTFKGWFTSKTGDNEVTSATKVGVTKDQNLYAQWTAKRFTVTFNSNGGNIEMGDKRVSYGSAYGALPTPIKNGYVFKGWFTSKTGDKQVVSTTKVEVTKNQNLYAQWTPAYTVTFNANGGVVAIPTKTVGQGLTYGNLPIPIKKGYLFKGWYTSKTGNNLVQETTVVTISKNQNLYAQWEKL